MANRRPPQSGRRMDFGRNDRGKNFRPGVSPWQGGAPGNDIPNLLPLAGGSTEATLALASNIINLLQPRQNAVPSLLDMPIRRDFGPPPGRFDRGYPPNRMGNQGNFRRTGNYNRSGERINSNRKSFRPNDGQRQPNKSTPKKEADPKNKSKESEDEKEKTDNTEGKQEEKKEVHKTRYDDINPQLLKCHICNKSMWDGRSFENHLSGRAHAIMMQKTVESYALTADTMRQEFKIREMKRTRKSGQQPVRDFYCAMCDMYAADGSAHRTTVGHRKLKKYLHPTCTTCHKEMPTRIELDEHRLTPEHLRMMQDKQDVGGKPKPEGKTKKQLPAPWLTQEIASLLEKKKLAKAKLMKTKSDADRESFRKIRNLCNTLCRDAQRQYDTSEVMMISSLQSEQQYLRDDRDKQRYRKQTDDKDKQGKEGQEKQDGEEKADGEEEKEKTKESIDKEDTILDYQEGEDLTGISNDRYPVYSTERGVGRSFLTEFKCFQCQLCKKLLDTEETAEVHLRTWRHHQLFVRLLNEKSGKETDNDTSDLSSELDSEISYLQECSSVDDNESLEVVSCLDDDEKRQVQKSKVDKDQCVTLKTKRPKKKNKKNSKFDSSNVTHSQSESQPSKRPLNSEESGNWKRRKTSPELDDNDDQPENGHVKEEKMNEDKDEGGDAAAFKAGDDTMQDEEYEDWMANVDDIKDLADENPEDNIKQEKEEEQIDQDIHDNVDETEEVGEEQPKQEDEKLEEDEKPVKEEKPSPVTNTKTRGSPRGRGRGRRRN